MTRVQSRGRLRSALASPTSSTPALSGTRRAWSPAQSTISQLAPAGTTTRRFVAVCSTLTSWGADDTRSSPGTGRTSSTELAQLGVARIGRVTLRDAVPAPAAGVPVIVIVASAAEPRAWRGGEPHGRRLAPLPATGFGSKNCAHTRRQS